MAADLAGALDALLAAPVDTQPPRCYVHVRTQRLTEEERAKVLALVDDPSREATWLSRSLRDLGIDLPANSIQRHRRRMCRCR
ncbi:MAG: hypothetical protein ACOYY2_13070 [Actinomycetota bacterium]